MAAHAVVAGNPAAEELRVRGIHDGVGRKRGDVALPDGDVGVACAGRDEAGVGDALFRDDGMEQLILLREELGARGNRQACVAQRSEQFPRLAERAGNGAGRKFIVGVFALVLQRGYQKSQVVFDRRHVRSFVVLP